jgi:energy-coupling factor transporter ATP-binding protein EcfA2
MNWAEAAPVLHGPVLRVGATLLGVAGISGIVAGFALGWWLPLLIILLVEASLVYRLRRATEAVIAGVEGAAPELALIATLLRRIEAEPVAAIRLKSALEKARSGEETASRCLASLKTVADFVDGRHNLLVRTLDAPMMYTVQVAFAAEAWRRRHGRALREWLRAVAEYEALASLATYAYEHPGDPFPELAPEAGPRFEGEEMGHPLLAERQCVRNSVCLGEKTKLLLVSGSNMSGKSTLLRVMGTNVVLASAGAPVRARRLRLSAMKLGTAIRVTDSLQAGKSGFYAEITRLREIMDLAAGKTPVLFLCDELLHGTNSHDRRIGADALLKALLERGAIGVVTTHDLALTEIAKADGRVRNAHFEDQVVEGKMVFDYKLRDGVVTKSNALELMRSVGLGVE